MEAVPRLPMISFRLKVSTERTSFSQPLKQYIAQFYGEEPDSYNNEIHSLESLRGGAVRPTIDLEGIQLLKKYYCQLHFLKSRFPMEELQAAAVYFSWQDTYSTMACTIPDIRFELMCILQNIGALHSQLGAEDQRVTPDGMKIACTHFQCAAWAFQVLRENYYQMVTYISSIEVVHFMELVCLAQAQECILEKSMMDNRKASIIAKVAVQVVDYYKKAQIMLQGGVDESNYSDYVQVAVFKEWVKYLNFKVAYHKCITLLYQGQQAEEQQKMGERVALYQAAAEQLEEARKLSVGLEKKQDITEALAFTSDFIEGKKKAAKNENDFIYHEEIPDKDTFPEIKGASLVKGIPFSISDIEVSGPDLFARLIPMEAHEASSLYSERKAKLLRQYGEMIENRDQKLAEFMSSLQIDFLNDIRQATGIPQDIVDRAAALSAKPNAIQDLISTMTKLSNSFHEVESFLNEIEDLLKQEEQSEKEYQKSVGERPPSIIATDLSREAAKYKEAHNKANESNQNLHRAMVAHVGNLKTLSQSLNQLQLNIPSVKLPDPNIDESALKEVEMLLSKVEEMRTQRSVLWAQLRDALHSDDITRVLVTKAENQNVEDIFTKELEKHKHLTTLIEQNTAAQDNIIRAFIDAYARFSDTRRYLQGLMTKRQSTINSLITSYESYEDLLSKANKGVEFYTKLETNVSKLLQRIKSSCRVQQEEREQVLSKITPPVNTEYKPTESNPPKLKDYLDSMKKKTSTKNTLGPAYTPINPVGNVPNTNETQIWPPGVRPTPLGSEINEGTTATYDSISRFPMNSRQTQGKTSELPKANENVGLTQPGIQGQQYFSSVGMSNQYTPDSYQAPPVSSFSTEKLLEKRLGALTMENKDGGSYTPYQQNPSYYNYANTSMGTTPQVPSSSFIPSNTLSYGYFQGTSGTVNEMNTGNKNLFNSASVEHSNINSGNNMMQPIGTFTNSNSAASSNFAQNQNNSSVAPMNVSDAQIHKNPYYGLYSENVKPTGTMTSAYSQFYNNHFSPYIPTHYQPNVNKDLPDSTHLPDGKNQPTNFYASGYAMSQNFQSSGLATVQSNKYYNMEVPTQVNSTYNSSYGASRTHPTNQNQPETFYSFDMQNPNSYSVNPNNIQVQNYNTPYNVANQNIGSTSESNVSSALNQSQYSEGYVGAGSLIAPNQFNPSYMYTQAGLNYSYNPNNSSSSTGGLTSPQCQPNYDASKYSNISNEPPFQNVIPSGGTNQTSTIDLLSGLDFSISQLPLEPELKKIEPPERKLESSVSNPQTRPGNSMTEIRSEDNKTKEIEVPKSTIKVLPSKPLDNENAKKLFLNEVDKYEKFVDVLSNKTLNGPTNLDLKWKEIQDTQDCEGIRKNISVARCYPMKNRFPDILPYDHSRIVLNSTEDDYINASLIQDISAFVPPVIVTQAPLQNTIFDFWTMIIEQHVTFIMCLLSQQEISGGTYFPQEKGKDLNVGNMVICLQNVTMKTHWIERLISINLPERKLSTTVVHVQFTDWSESLLPSSPVPLINFVTEFISLHQQQKVFSNPILIHCSSGIGRSGVACLLLFAILEATNNATLPDLTSLANKITLSRKNILRDREHLKFAYQAFLAYMKKTNSNGATSSLDTMKENRDVESSLKNDPFNCLDPLWANKRNQK